jgi:hypothetical protein
MHLTLASSLVTIVAVLTSCLAYIFDCNETHVYNPNWPPHAKFHNAQTLLLGTSSASSPSFSCRASTTFAQQS